ncbi:hypothetical protein [Paenibacillus sp. SN-8-1]|uniref:hypothetical protein n=1 Tax=Paenibacillus sp. SN-8-1 TaxID=3435409 RepID=UPI003D9A69A5
MPDVSKRLAKGIFSTASSTLYTVPASTTTFLKALTICNKTATDATVTLLLAGTEVIYQHTIKAKDSITIPFLDQILNAGETITGLAGTASALTYYMSGREVS